MKFCINKSVFDRGKLLLEQRSPSHIKETYPEVVAKMDFEVLYGGKAWKVSEHK